MSKKIYSQNDETLTRYFNDIKNSKPITHEEEIELSKRIILGDQKAINELLEANLKFVISIAREYQYLGVDINDLINDGNEGLIRAALKFDYTRGFRFISYAVWWIRQSIIQGLNNNSRLIRLPANVINQLQGIKKNIEKLEQTSDITSLETIDCNLRELITNDKVVSINTIVNENGDEMIDLIQGEFFQQPDEINSDKVFIRKEIDNTLSILTSRERDIIISYFGLDDVCEPMTLEVIGERYGLTKERVRQIKQRAIRKLRHNSCDLYALINAGK